MFGAMLFLVSLKQQKGVRHLSLACIEVSIVKVSWLILDHKQFAGRGDLEIRFTSLQPQQQLHNLGRQAAFVTR